MASSLTTINDKAADAVVILVLGTYRAQRAADDGLVPHSAVHRCWIYDHKARTFPRVRGLTGNFGRWGGWGSNPTTGGL
jgi:hypothetical protein